MPFIYHAIRCAGTTYVSSYAEQTFFRASSAQDLCRRRRGRCCEKGDEAVVEHVARAQASDGDGHCLVCIAVVFGLGATVLCDRLSAAWERRGVGASAARR